MDIERHESFKILATDFLSNESKRDLFKKEKIILLKTEKRENFREALIDENILHTLKN